MCFISAKNLPFSGKINPKIRNCIRLKAVKIKNSEHIVVFLVSFVFFNVLERSDVLGKGIDGCWEPSMFGFPASQ